MTDVCAERTAELGGVIGGVCLGVFGTLIVVLLFSLLSSWKS